MASSHVNAPLLAGGASGSTSGPVVAWESARKKSRQLETQLYKKLQEFAQVQTALMNEAAQGKRSQSKQAMHGGDLEMGRTVPSSSSSSSSALAASSSSAFPGASPLLQYESLVGDLDQLLQSFASTIDAMAKILADSSSGGGGFGASSAASKDSLSTDANLYLVSKSRAVLQENLHEFRRTKQNIQAALARQELLSGAAERNSEGTGAATRGRTEQLLREGKGLQHSLDRADDVIAQAMSTRDSMFSQGAVFTGVRGKLTQLNTTFPVVGQLLSRINFSKQRDMIVLACVIATCFFFTFVYVMSKP